MLRFIVRFAVFTIVIGISLYIGVQWKLKEDLKYFASKLGNNVQFDYLSSAMSLSGNVIVKGINLRFKQLDINLSVNQVKYSAGSIFEMAFWGQQLRQLKQPKELYLSVDEAVLYLTPSLVKFIANTEQTDTYNALMAAACGKIKHIGINQYFSMGYDYIVFSSEARFYQDDYSGNLIGNGWIDIEETSKIDYKLNMTGVYETSEKPNQNEQIPSIEMLELDVLDKGYNQRKNGYCGSKAGISADQFIEQHIKILVEKLKSVGIKMTPSGQQFYRDLMQPSSKMHLLIEPSANFSFSDFGYYDEQELRNLLGLKLEINGKNVEKFFNDWSLDKFNQIIVKDLYADDNEDLQKRYETITIKRRYHQVPTIQASNFIGFDIRVVRDDDKEYQGKLIKIENNRLYIDRRVGSGTVQVSVEKKRIKTFFIYK